MKKIIDILLIFAIFLAASSFLFDIRNTVKYGGVDLRNRVVGARLLKLHKDPYFYKWQQDDPVKLLDPRDNPEWKVNRVTVTPPVLVLASVSADWSYKIQRFIWFFLQWLLFLLSLFFLGKCTASLTKKKLIWIIGLFFVGSSFFWRLHIERGQIYILYVFLISLSIWSYRKNEFLSGIILGFLTGLRFLYLLFSLPFIIKKRFKYILGNIVGFIATLGATFFFAGMPVWKSYFAAMNEHGLIHFNYFYQSSYQYPSQNIEGFLDLYKLQNIPIFDTSLQYLFRSVGILISKNILFFTFTILLFVILFIFVKKVKNFDHRIYFLVGSLLVFCSEFFLPAARYDYNNVLLLIPIALIILNFQKWLNDD